MGVRAVLPEPVPLADDAARRAAVGEHRRSLLVEAGAGSGKTAIMAGRVAMLLADGVAPKLIAAVSFTELASSELLSRVRDFVAALLGGDVPTEMKSCLPLGLSADQRAALADAAESIDQVACTTIHGFCQRLIKPYPAEANIDPGARVTDKSEADLVFAEVKDAWLRDKLSRPEASLLAEMVVEDVDKAMAAVDSILDCLRKHPDVEGPSHPPIGSITDAYVSSIKTLGDFVERSRVREPETIEIVGHFRTHASVLPSAPHDSPTALVLLLGATPTRELLTKAGTFSAYQKKGKWVAAGKLVGVSKIDAGILNDEADRHYTACCEAWKSLKATIGACALSRLVEELRPAIAEFQAKKRAVGLLDFDDLIQSALRLLRGRDDVREALSRRYARVLVDEFQDTDPAQCEIFWRLCGDPAPGADPSDWRSFAIRPGALFLVGDPKQGIYRFRGADVAAYVRARSAFAGAGATSSISTNFRSRAGILTYVNQRFRGPLSDAGQPGFSDLDPFHADHDGHCGAVALDVDLGDGPTDVTTRRDAEAEAVAETCARLVARALVRDRKTGEMRPCRAGDIALLAPGSTDLWRYEAALEERGIAVATQAGKGFFKQQEVQDLIALTRAIADGRDTLALAAFLRGPIVGLTEEQMLDVVWALPKDPAKPDSLPALSLSIDSDAIADPYVRAVFARLQYLMRRVGASTTPHALVSQAVDGFRVRAMLLRRHPRQAERALANVDQFLELSKPYAVRGLRAFAEAMAAAWESARTEGGKFVEGRVDAQEEAVSVYSMHSSKGLEWPVVIPINSMGPPMPIDSEIVDRTNGRLFMSVLGVKPLGYELAHAAEKAEVDRERVRLWYVAATRARELLVIPRASVPVDPGAWGSIVDLALADLSPLELSPATAKSEAKSAAPANQQTEDVWADEAAKVVGAHRPLTWKNPSQHDGPTSEDADVEAVRAMGSDGESLGDLLAPIKGGRARGLVMHKLFEEVLTGETLDSAEPLETRAAELIRELGHEPKEAASEGLSAKEIAGCVRKALALPEIAALRPTLTPEFPIYDFEKGDKAGEADIAVAGVADAVSQDASGAPNVIVDWKSDVMPSKEDIARYRQQVRDYLLAVGAREGLVVFATTGEILKVQHP